MNLEYLTETNWQLNFTDHRLVSPIEPTELTELIEPIELIQLIELI